MYRAQNYEIMTKDKRPQDDCGDLNGWTFESSEHGGEYPDLMPQCIKATDSEGRACVYVPVTVNGSVVDSKGFVCDNSKGAAVKFARYSDEKQNEPSAKSGCWGGVRCRANGLTLKELLKTMILQSLKRGG